MSTSKDPVQERALALIDEALRPDAYPRCKSCFTFDEMIDEFMKPRDGESFLLALKAWLRAVDSAVGERRSIVLNGADDDAWDECVWWRKVFKPWLVSLVGWSATSELGRAADEEGYRRMFSRWEERWQAVAELEATH